MNIVPELRGIITATVEGLGYELWGCEYLSQGHNSILRVYIDTPAGVTVDDCGRVSKQLSAVLDVEDPIHGEYSLEVSSPGMDRPLYTPEQFERYQGSAVKVKLHTPMDGRRKFAGVIMAVTETQLQLQLEQQVVELAFAEIDKAHLVPQ